MIWLAIIGWYILGVIVFIYAWNIDCDITIGALLFGLIASIFGPLMIIPVLIDYGLGKIKTPDFLNIVIIKKRRA